MDAYLDQELNQELNQEQTDGSTLNAQQTISFSFSSQSTIYLSQSISPSISAHLVKRVGGYWLATLKSWLHVTHKHRVHDKRSPSVQVFHHIFNEAVHSSSQFIIAHHHHGHRTSAKSMACKAGCLALPDFLFFGTCGAHRPIIKAFHLLTRIKKVKCPDVVLPGCTSNCYQQVQLVPIGDNASPL